VPEGHTIHRYARVHRALLVDRRVAAWSPQGRFAEGAAIIDGTACAGIEAYGKHLFYRFEANGKTPDDLILHVHLGLFGRFRQYGEEPRPPTAGTRLVLSTGAAQLQLAGPSVCELIAPVARAVLRARLGPDPLRDDDPASAFSALSGRRAAIGQVLLDQSVIAGVGNVYRAELLFLLGIHPDRPARDIDATTLRELWRVLRRLLRDGERRGRIITVQPRDRSRPPSRLQRDERLYVYRRAGLPCRRCSTPVLTWELGARPVYACPRCQPV
jgi:formamidopyrimidine-DNA glycosylase